MKEQIKAKIERIFDNPEAWHVVKNTYGDVTINEPILKVEWVADQILALFPQGEGGLLGEDDICSYCEDYPCELWEGDGYSTCSKFQDLTELAQAQHALDQQHEALALKEQMERVIKKIYKSYSYLRCLCLAAEDGSEKAKGYDLAMNEALSELVNLKAELEGHAQVLELGCRYLDNKDKCEKGLLINGKCPSECVYYDDGSR